MTKINRNHCQLELFMDKYDKKQLLLLDKNTSSIDNESGPNNTISNIFENNYENNKNKKEFRFQLTERGKNNLKIMRRNGNLL